MAMFPTEQGMEYARRLELKKDYGVKELGEPFASGWDSRVYKFSYQSIPHVLCVYDVVMPGFEPIDIHTLEAYVRLTKSAKSVFDGKRELFDENNKSLGTYLININPFSSFGPIVLPDNEVNGKLGAIRPFVPGNNLGSAERKEFDPLHALVKLMRERFDFNAISFSGVNVKKPSDNAYDITDIIGDLRKFQEELKDRQF